MKKKKVAVPFPDKRTLMWTLTKLSKYFVGYLHFNESKGETPADGSSYDLLGKDSHKLSGIFMIFEFVEKMNTLSSEKSIRLELNEDAAKVAAQIRERLEAEGLNVDKSMEHASEMAKMWTHIDNIDKNDIN
tara:strand:- start:451 stop:846 length:396 start_codon:yes stop_codon:yes gene_type:complete